MTNEELNEAIYARLNEAHIRVEVARLAWGCGYVLPEIVMPSGEHVDGAYVFLNTDEPVHPEFEKAYDEFVQEMTALGMESANKPVVVESEPVGPR